MKTTPVPLRLDKDLRRTLREGARRTPHKQQDLVRLTLRRYLRGVIEAEAKEQAGRITNVEPWPRATLEAAYRRVGKYWDALEDAAIRAQGSPRFED